MTPMSKDKTAEEIERELIKKEAMDKYPDRARNGLSFPDYNATQRMAYINGIITERTRSAQQLKEYKEKLKEAIRIIEKLQNSWISAEHYWGSETNEITDTFLDATKILIVGCPKQGQDQQPPEQEP